MAEICFIPRRESAVAQVKVAETVVDGKFDIGVAIVCENYYSVIRQEANCGLFNCRNHLDCRIEEEESDSRKIRLVIER